MFESAELGHAVDERTYEKRAPALRADLLDIQYRLLEARTFPVVVLVSGVDGAGKGETVNLLHEWMDPRHVRGHAFAAPTDEERERPAMWRFWRALPPKGTVGVLFGSWYTSPIVDRVYRRIGARALEVEVDRIRRFEAMLVAEGALVLKLWFHLSKAKQRERLRALERSRHTAWRVTKADWEHFERYDRFARTSEHVLRATSTGPAPWVVIEGACPRYRALTTAQLIHDGIKDRLEWHERQTSSARSARHKHPAPPPPPLLPASDTRRILASLPFTERLSKEKFERQLEKRQGEINALSRHPKLRDRAVVCVFEGMDAAGKGGAIRRLTHALDARSYRVIPIAAPTDVERAQPYLWRFWQHLPRRGQWAIFDRSWYGRVLVERVEKLCAPDDYMRGFGEINDFEAELTAHGIVVLKFWLAITEAEQLRRFREREKTRFKRFKITAEDWRNREKWADYELAACDMLDRTSTPHAPWTLLEANDKHLARIRVLETVRDRLEATL